VTWDEALDLVKDRSEWRNCTARCALAARGRTKVYGKDCKEYVNSRDQQP